MLFFLSVRKVFLLPQRKMRRFPVRSRGFMRWGKRKSVTWRFGSAELRAFLPAELNLKAGDLLPVTLRGRGVFLFDAETGGRLL